MKLKELKGQQSLKGQKVKTPTGVVGFWLSQWDKGVWLTMTPKSQGRVYPIFVNALTDCLEWEITVDPVNCNTLTDLKYIDLTK